MPLPAAIAQQGSVTQLLRSATRPCGPGAKKSTHSAVLQASALLTGRCENLSIDGYKNALQPYGTIMQASCVAQLRLSRAKRRNLFSDHSRFFTPRLVLITGYFQTGCERLYLLQLPNSDDSSVMLAVAGRTRLTSTHPAKAPLSPALLRPRLTPFAPISSPCSARSALVIPQAKASAAAAAKALSSSKPVTAAAKSAAAASTMLGGFLIIPELNVLNGVLLALGVLYLSTGMRHFLRVMPVSAVR